MLTVVLWDLDGTILDSDSLAKEGTRYGFKEVLGREPTQNEFDQLIGRPVTTVYKEWFVEDLALQILNMGTHFYQERSEQIPCYPGIPELLNELKRMGYRMGIVSSKRRFHVMRELESKKLNFLFDVIVAQEDTQQHKPLPDPLVLAARLLESSPEDCIYIGDQPSDIRAADAAGMKSIAALWGDGKIEKLKPMCPAFLAHSPTDIINCIKQTETII